MKLDVCFVLYIGTSFDPYLWDNSFLFFYLHSLKLYWKVYVYRSVGALCAECDVYEETHIW